MIDWPRGSTEMAARIREFDWAKTTLGASAGWSERLKAAVELTIASPLISSVVCGTRRILIYNDAAARLYGKAHPAALGVPLPETFPAGYAPVKDYYDQVFAGESVSVAAQPLDTRDEGATEYFDAWLIPLRDESGGVIAAHMFGFDVSERVIVQGALRASEQRLQRVLETDAVAVLFFNPGGVLTDANDVFLRMTGYSRQDVHSQQLTWQQMTPPEWHAVSQEQMDRFFAEGRIGPYEKEYLRKDGTRAWMLFSGRDLGDGTIVELGVDITDRKRAEEALRESEKRLKAAFEAVPVAIGVLDAEGRTTLSNEAFDRFLPTNLMPSRDPERIKHWRGWHSNGTPLDPSDFPGARAVRGDRVVPGVELLHTQADGREVWTSVSTVPLIDERGHSTGLVSVISDIDALKRNAEALRESEERQKFLLKLSDALRPIDDPVEVADTACRLLVGHLGGSQAQYADMSGASGEEMGEIRGEYVGTGEPMPRRFPLAQFGEPVLETLRAGRTLILSNAARDPLLGEEQRSAFHAVGAPSTISVPLVKGGRWIAAFTVHDASPREWSGRDVELTEDVAERTWAAIERARAEAALRESEARYRSVFETMTEGFGIGEVIRDSASQAIDFRYLELNPALEKHTGVTTHFLLGRPFKEAFPDLPDAYFNYWLGVFQKAVDTQSVGTYENYFPPIDRWLAGTVTPAGGQRFYVFYQDVTSRKRVELALRESEERFREFAASSSDALWIRDATTFAFEFASPALRAIYGVTPDAVIADPNLLNSLVIPEERDEVSRRVDRIGAGERIVQEYRILRPTDHAFRWIRSTGFPLPDAQGRVHRIAAIASDITEAKLAAEHQAVLLAELQHRVRNIMAVVRAITARTGERAETVPEYAGLMAGRLLALARVQVLLTRAANAGVGIRTIVQDEVSAQANHTGQYDLAGPDIRLSPKAAELLTLAIHELATNAVKYGAFSVPTGQVMVQWESIEKQGAPWFRLDWTETGAAGPPGAEPARPRRRGFGTELIEARIPYELGGHGKVSIEPGGARARLEFPLQEGTSILATDAPQGAATVFGGALDMTGEARLTGHRVLVVEDDYYLATDTARALTGADAVVLGPFPNEGAARKALDNERPSAAVIDINLGSGPSFDLAGFLKENSIPFVFITGYDQAAIPPEFREAPRLQKPVDFKQIVNALASALGVKS